MTQRARIENILLRGGLAKLFQLLLLFGRNILIIPILLSTWGVEKYGIWIAVISFFDLLMSLDSGHSNYIANEFNRLFFEDKTKAAHILGSSIRVAYFSGIIQLLLIVGVWFLGGFHLLFPTSLESTYEIFLGVLALVLFRFLIGSTRGILIKTIFPLGYMDRSTYLKSCERIVEIIILVIAGFWAFSILKTCILFATFRFLYSILALLLIRKWMPDFFPWWKSGDMKTGIKNYFISLSLTLNFFVDRFSKDGLNLLISSTLGLAVLPIYSTIKTLINFATQGTNLIMGPLQPEFVRFHALNHFMKIVESMKMNWIISNIILNIPFIIAIYFIGDLYHIWTDHQIVFNVQLFSYLVVSVLLYNYGNSYLTYLKGINHIRALLVITFTRTAILIALSMILLRTMGLNGVGLSMLITELITSVSIPFFFVQRVLKSNDYKISAYDRTLPLISIIVVSVVYLLFANSKLHFSLSAIAICVLIGITALQWQALNKEIKLRMLNLLMKFRILKANL